MLKPNVPDLPLTTRADIERARERVLSNKSLVYYQVILGFQPIPSIDQRLGASAFQAHPATVEMILRSHSRELFNAEAQYYLEHARCESELRLWLAALASRVNEEVRAQAKKNQYHYHCAPSEQESALKEELLLCIDLWIATFQGKEPREISAGIEQPDRALARAEAFKDPALEAQDQHRRRKGHGEKKPVRRNAKYEGIDKALREISEARPKNHEEVFGFLESRNIALPDRKTFTGAGGWLHGFHRTALRRGHGSRRHGEDWVFPLSPAAQKVVSETTFGNYSSLPVSTRDPWACGHPSIRRPGQN